MKGETEVGSITLDKSKDGAMQSIEYTGEAGTLTLVADGGMYIHKLIVANLGDASTEKNELGYYVCEAGNAGNFLTMLDLANAKSSATERTCIFLPNGVYDLGMLQVLPDVLYASRIREIIQYARTFVCFLTRIHTTATVTVNTTGKIQIFTVL